MTDSKEKIETLEEEEALRDMIVESLAEDGEHSEKEYRSLLKKT